MDYCKLKKDVALVFDFDGTMCRLFKNYNLNKVVVTLCDKMKDHGIEFSTENDSFDIFSEVIRQTEEGSATREKALIDADQIITAAEIESINTGELVNGVEIAIPFLEKTGFSIGIATNNSVQCVATFMQKNCPSTIIPIVGRVGAKPELMKPNAWSVLEVLKKMNRLPENTIFIGDSQPDYLSAISAGCEFIGMAPTDSKRQRLLQVVSESSIVSDFNELLTLLKIAI